MHTSTVTHLAATSTERVSTHASDLYFTTIINEPGRPQKDEFIRLLLHETLGKCGNLKDGTNLT